MTLIRLHWHHPNIGDISEITCPAHASEVRDALRVLGMGCIGSDGSVGIPGYEGPGPIPVCLRCSAPAHVPPRALLRQWFGDAS